jgi:hypothetical protein
MQAKIESYLESLSRQVQTGSLSMTLCKDYISNLPVLYKSDLEFRLLFDWHFSPQGRQLSVQDIHPLFIPQLNITSALAKKFNLSYQFKQLLIFHALYDLKEKTILEVGGSLPSEVVFELFGVREYIDNESPEYVEAWNGEYITGGEGISFMRPQIWPLNSCDTLTVTQRQFLLKD